MHFKRLRLNGFKSFVDPTELLIEEGVTGIVGPNGCGKSNLLEALRWVMGESSAKSMRGSDMDDVIFAGTDKRSPRPYAEVVLTIDNTTRLAPAQFNHEDTLEISRKITRDMGSQYRINGKEVRARDLQILFADAATGSNSPALVRQGQINQLIHAKPKQRRVILEEAAGIGGLYSRRHEAELRMRAATQNLERVEDILKTTETQMNNLRRQSKQAEKYRQLSSDIRKTEALLLSVLYELATEEKFIAERNLRKIAEEVGQAEIKVSQLLQKEMELQEKVTPYREELAIASAILKKAEIEAATIVAQLDDAQGRIHRLERAKENVQKDSLREGDLFTDAENAYIRTQGELESLKTAEQDMPEEIENLQARLDVGQKELAVSETRLEQLRNEISELQSRNKSLNENADSARNRMLRLENEFLSISEQEKKAGESTLNDFATDTLTSEIEQLQNSLAEKKQAFSEIAQKINELRQNDNNLREKMLKSEGIVNKLMAEMKGLAAIAERGTQKGSARLIDEIIVESGYEKALGVVFGDDLSFNDDIKQPRYWRLLPEKNSVALPPEAIPLSDYVKQIPDFLKIALSQVGVIDETRGGDLQKSLPIGGVLVSTTGKLWRSDGFVIADGTKTQAAVILEQKNRLLTLKDEYHKAEQEFAIDKQAYEAIKLERNTLQQSEIQISTEIKNIERNLQTIERKLYDVQNNRKLAESKLQNLIDKRTLIERELSEAKNILEKALDDLSKISGTDHLKEETEKLKQQVTEKRMNLADARALLETHRRTTKDRENRIKTLTKDLSDWKERKQKAGERKADCEKRLVSIEKDLTEALPLPDKLKEKSISAKENVDITSQRYNQANEASASLEGELSVLSKELRESQANASSLREKKVRFEASQETALLKEQEIIEKIKEKVENTPDELRHELEQRPDENTPEVAVIEENLRQLIRSRDNLGPVNLVAERELKEVEEQAGTLINEKNDLSLAMRKLSGAINDINKEGRERMLKAFEIVNENFKKLFGHLFSGGVAELELIESDDPLEAGLEVRACPPGKKTNSLSLLSGGEQALTCMALIFAVFLTNPSPICVLDEVDAPLDDANVERYCTMINEMTKVTDTRFLVITHHALTMARTDRLFGVTMAERGVSQLVSVDLKSAEKLLEEV